MNVYVYYSLECKLCQCHSFFFFLRFSNLSLSLCLSFFLLPFFFLLFKFEFSCLVLSLSLSLSLLSFILSSVETAYTREYKHKSTLYFRYTHRNTVIAIQYINLKGKLTISKRIGSSYLPRNVPSLLGQAWR